MFFQGLALVEMLWLAACALGGWLMGATIIRIAMPQTAPEKFAALPAELKIQVRIGGFGGLLLSVFLGAGLIHLNAYLAGLAIVQVLLWMVSGAWLGTMLAFVLVINDYHEVRVAMYDFSGALWMMGAMAGGVGGGFLGGIAQAQNWWTILIYGVVAAASGLVVGFGVGVILTRGLRQYMLRLHA